MDDSDGAVPRTRRFGPGWVTAAAFIGPGTVTTMTIAGADHGYTLLWAVVVAVLLAIVLQEMAGRLALGRQAAFATVLRERFGGWRRTALVALVVLAIFFGNAAFQSGNLIGASLGLQVLRDAPVWLWTLAVADIVFVILWIGRTRRITTGLSAGVAVMALAFVTTAFVSPLDAADMGAGLVPSIPAGAELLVIAAIGTTVVPYNLFLQSSLTREFGWGQRQLRWMRLDTILSITVGGIMAAAILFTSAALLRGQSIASAADMAQQLGPLLGSVARGFFGFGLFFTGLTSAIAAPFAAAFALTQMLGGAWTDGGTRGTRFRAIWISVLVAGMVPVLLGAAPVAVILAAQAFNGLILPILAVLLLIVVNDTAMGPLRNRWRANLVGGIAVAAAFLLGARFIITALAGA